MLRLMQEGMAACSYRRREGMNVRGLKIALVFVLLLSALAVPVAAQQQSTGYTVPVTGEAPSFTAETVNFGGTLLIASFDWEGSTLLVKGRLDGTITDGGRSAIGNIRREVVLPVAYVEGGCEGISLVLEPLGPEVSEYMFFLSPVLLDGSTQPRAEKLLCAAGHLVDNHAPASALANLLNQVLRALT
jgi:hypothetical protein